MALCLCMVFALIPVGVRAVQTEPASIEAQVRAFADSIDQSDAVSNAARALATHGMTKGGKKLTIGKGHALTAVLFNSEILQLALIEGCTEIITTMHRLDLSEYLAASDCSACGWYGDGGSEYMVATVVDGYSDLLLVNKRPYTGKRNSCDEALDWMVGAAFLSLEVRRTKTTADEITYQVTCSITDRFDFTTSSNSFFKALISGIGARLFKEFDWESKVTFSLTVPNSCTHGSQARSYSYDPAAKAFTWNGTDTVTERTHTDINGNLRHYYELSQPIRLLHDRPWVLEYDAGGVWNVELAALAEHSALAPNLLLSTRAYLSLSQLEWFLVPYDQGVAKQSRHHRWGIGLKDYFSYPANRTCTFRLENQLGADGSNLVLLTVRDTKTGEVLMDRVPMDDYYRNNINHGDVYLVSDAHNGWNGVDLYINFFGSREYRFNAETFDLRVWESGEENEGLSHYEKTGSTPSTCTSRGYTTYTCIACGHSKKADYLPVTEHTWGDWEALSPTLRQHTCTGCGAQEQEMLPILCGDTDSNGTLNAMDLILLRQYLAGWDVTVSPGGDANGDGSCNALDLILLRQHLAGWDVTLGA